MLSTLPPETRSELVQRYRFKHALDSPIHLGRAVVPNWQEPPHVRLICERAMYALETGGKLMVFAPPRHGKGLALDTPIPTPTGWRAFGDLQPGDAVFGGDGKPCRVVATSPVWHLDCFEITTDSGEVLVADGPHEWLVTLDNRHPAHRRETAALARRTGKAPRVQTAALSLPDVPLPIDPYVLGVWLGDGRSAGSSITSADPEIVEELRRAGETVRKGCGKFEFYVSDGRRLGRGHGTQTLHARLRALNLLRNKHIPPAYLRSSPDQRLALVQGLIDTDGHVAPDGQVEFCTTIPALRDGVAELVRSLGVKAQILSGRATLEGRDCGPKWRVMFYMANAARLPRKLARCRDASAPRRRHYLQRFRPIPSVPTRCIEVDSPDHLFLAGRTMVPTSNSEMLSHLIPAWLCLSTARRRAVLLSYGQTYAATWGLKALETVLQVGPRFGVTVNPRKSGAGDWLLSNGSGMLSTGIGGSVTGRGADPLLTDDLVKNEAEALSQKYRDRAWNAYRATAETRKDYEVVAQILTFTRWHEDDIGGRLLAADTDHEWEVVRLPALAHTDDDALGRELGEALWEARFGAEYLRKLRLPSGIGESWFSALYQQRPAPPEGTKFTRAMARFYGLEGQMIVSRKDGKEDVVLDPRAGVLFATMDTALVESKAADYTVIALWCYVGGYLVLAELVRVKQDWTDHEALVANFLKAHPGVQFIGVEDAITAKVLIKNLKRNGAPVRALPTGGQSKLARAQTAITLWQNERVLLPEHLREGEVLEEIVAFDRAEHDDVVDVLAYAANEARKMSATAGGWGLQTCKSCGTSYIGKCACGAVSA